MGTWSMQILWRVGHVGCNDVSIESHFECLMAWDCQWPDWWLGHQYQVRLTDRFGYLFEPSLEGWTQRYRGRAYWGLTFGQWSRWPCYGVLPRVWGSRESEKPTSKIPSYVPYVPLIIINCQLACVNLYSSANHKDQIDKVHNKKRSDNLNLK